MGVSKFIAVYQQAFVKAWTTHLVAKQNENFHIAKRCPTDGHLRTIHYFITYRKSMTGHEH